MKSANQTEAELLKELKILKEKNARLEKQLIQKAKSSQKDFNKIFSNAPIPISIINKNGTPNILIKYLRMPLDIH